MKFYYKNIEQSELVPFDSGGHGMAAELKAIRNHIKDFLERKYLT